MKHSLTWIDPSSAARAVGVFCFVLGLLFIPLFLLSVAAESDKIPPVVFVLAIMMPPFYGLVGFVVGGIASWLYNKVVIRTGGIQIELSAVGESLGQPTA